MVHRFQPNFRDHVLVIEVDEGNERKWLHSYFGFFSNISSFFSVSSSIYFSNFLSVQLFEAGQFITETINHGVEGWI